MPDRVVNSTVTKLLFFNLMAALGTHGFSRGGRRINR